MAFNVAIAFGSLALIWVFLHFLLSLTQDGMEPPVVATAVPFLGPLVGMIKGKSKYYVALRDKFNLPLYTLRLPFSRIYVLNSPELIPPVQKQWRTLSFAPFTVLAGKMLGMSKQSVHLMQQGLTDDDGFSTTWVQRVTPILGPGEDLDAINRRSIEVFLDDIRKLAADGKTRLGLWEWTQQSTLKATSEAIYGPQNPYRDPEIQKAWRVFEASYLDLAISPLPSWFSPRVLRARETCAAAMIKYMEKGGHKSASGLVRARHDHHRYDYNFALEDVARGELGNTFAVLGNTTPCAWWFLYHIFSDEKVLADIRHELDALVRINKEKNTYSIDLAGIRTSCPTLLSTFQETLRYRSANSATRMVLEDVVVGGRFRLKKGSMLLIPAPVQHTDVPTWGENAKVFDHMRFARIAPGKRRQSRVAFRAFGGGHVLCPGRHFASTEIMALGALLVLQFDIKPVGGQWIEPKCEKTPIAAGFPVPDDDMPVEIHVRHPGRQWHVTLTGSNKAMGIVSEDASGAGNGVES